MNCELSRSLLHGYLDGELDPVRAQEFEQHLENCSPCIAQLEAQETLRGSLRKAGQRGSCGVRRRAPPL